MSDDAFKVNATVFMEHTRDTSVKLARGECLFILTDNGLEEAPSTLTGEVLVMSEHFGCWPVVALKVKRRDAPQWRNTTDADHRRMMARVRRQLAPKLHGEAA